MLRQFLSRVQTAILLRPRRVLIGSAGVTLLAIVLGLQVEFRTSRSELAPPDDPDQRRFSRLLEEYRGSEALIACVLADGGASDAAGLATFTDRLAERFRRDARVESVFHRIDTRWFREHLLYLLPEVDRRRIDDVLDRHEDLGTALAAARNLTGLNELLAARIRRDLQAPQTGPAAEAARGVEALRALLRQQHELLRDPSAARQRWAAGPLQPDSTTGYLTTRDGSVYFLFVSPVSADDSLLARRALLAAMRGHADALGREYPGYRVAFTGQPALVVEEMTTVRRDTWRTSLVAVVGVTVLTFLVFRWRFHVLLVLGALALGIVWAFGAVRLELGYLNLITSSFISTLVGIGVAYGIHPISEYELEGAHTQDPVATLRESFHRTGAAVTVAAVTTAAAFLSIQLMRFRGFGELGLVAGVGVLLCLAAAMITLPAMLVVYSRWRRRRDREGGHRPATVVDRVWIERVAGRICRFPRTVGWLSLLTTLVAAWAAAGLRFDANILDLLPRGAESVRFQRIMVLESELAPMFNIVVADDLKELREMARRSAAEPAIAGFDSVLRFLPDDEAAALRTVERVREAVAAVQWPARPEPLERDRLTAALDELESVLATAADEAFGAGLGELAAALEGARAEAEASRELVVTAPASSLAAWNVSQLDLWERAGRLVESLRSPAAAPPTAATLPDEIRARYFTASGKPMGFLFPVGGVFELDALREYVDASLRVDAEVTGFPLVFYKMSQRITSGFRRAVLLGSLLVGLILLVDYRDLRDAILALIPLTIGVVWMMGVMRLLGLSFNFANLVAIPLIIGVGIDNGVHVIHRVRFEGRMGMTVVLRHTGRAILIASLTTMIGFGSLALASHRGLSSLGLVLFLGVGACLVTSTIVLPNLLVLLGLVER